VTTHDLRLENELAEEARLEESAGPFTALYGHWERHQWSPLRLDFRTDAATFAALDPEKRDGFVWMFANRFLAEFNVARLLAQFLLGERRDEDTFLQAVFVYHVLGEGVMARVGQHLAAGRVEIYESLCRSSPDGAKRDAAPPPLTAPAARAANAAGLGNREPVR
jgi:hypothetical protein